MHRAFSRRPMQATINLMFRFGVRLCLGLFLVLLPNLSGQNTTTATRPSHLPGKSSAGEIEAGIYRNPAFGFRYRLPYGWVDRTQVMQDRDAADQSPQPSKAQVLLAVFERPPEATGETVNSTVVIAAESTSSYPGLKTAADYFGPLEEVVTAKGFKVANEPYEFPIGAKQLAREDFSKDLGKLTMQQATLVMLAKGYIVSFTFIGGSEDEVEELLEGVSFPTAQTSGSPHPLHPSSSPSSPSGK